MPSAPFRPTVPPRWHLTKALREPSVDNSSRNHISPGKSWNALASEHLYLLFQSTFLRRIRLQPKVFFIVRSRLLPLVTALVGNSSVVVSDGIFCVKLYGLGEVGYCFVELPLLAVGFTPEVVDVDSHLKCNTWFQKVSAGVL